MWCCLALAGALPCISASLAHKGCRHSVHPNLVPPLSPAKRRSESSWQPFPVTPHWPLLITVPPHTAFDSQVQPRATALSLLSPASEHWSETGAIHFPLAPHAHTHPARHQSSQGEDVAQQPARPCCALLVTRRTWPRLPPNPRSSWTGPETKAVVSGARDTWDSPGADSPAPGGLALWVPPSRHNWKPELGA